MNWKSLLASLLMIALVVGYGWITVRGTHDTYNSPDANGYMAQAALLANTGTTELLPREDAEGRPFWGFFTTAWAPISRIPAKISDLLFSSEEKGSSESQSDKKADEGPKKDDETAKAKVKVNAESELSGEDAAEEGEEEKYDDPFARTAEERLAYLGLHWLENDRGEFWSRYPPGLGVLLAGPYLLFGPQVATWVQPLLAALTLLFLFLLCKPYIGYWGALLGTAIYALHPMAFVHALNWGAHTPVAFCLVAGFYLLDSWARHPSLWKVIVAAFLLGSMPSFRYAEVIAGIAVGGFMLIHVVRQRAPAWHLVVALLVASIPITFLLIRNYMAFGSPWDTGYALTGEQQAGTGFSVEHFVGKWRPFLLSLMGNGLGFFFALGLAGLIGMFGRKNTRPIAFLIGLSVVLITGAYTAYYWGGQREMGLRFLLPTFPLYILPALWLVKEMSTTRAAQVGVAFLIVVQMALFGSKAWEDGKNEAQKMDRMEVAYEFLAEHVPAGSVLIADRRLAETLQFYPQWQLLDGGLIGGSGRGFGRSSRGRGAQGRQGSQNGAPARANPMQTGKARKLRVRYDVRDSFERGRLIADDLYEIINEGKPVYWIGSSRTVTGFKDKLVSGDSFQSIAKIELPKPVRKRATRSRRGFGNFNIGNMFGPTAGQKLELFQLVLFDDSAESLTEKESGEASGKKADEKTGIERAGTGKAVPVEASMKKER